MSPSLQPEQQLEWVKRAVVLIQALASFTIQAKALQDVFVDFAILSNIDGALLETDTATDHLTLEALQAAIPVVLEVLTLIEDDANANAKRKALEAVLAGPVF